MSVSYTHLDVYKRQLSDMAKTYGIELSTLKESAGENELEQIKDDIKVEKAVELVACAAVEK